MTAILTDTPLAVNEGTREQMAVRRIATRYMGEGSIPTQAFLRGECDDSVIMRGIADLVGAAYKMLDAVGDQIGISDEQGSAMDCLQQVLEYPVAKESPNEAAA